MANQLTKQSGENEIKSYFAEVLKLSNSDEKFPVNLNDVWPLVYSEKSKAVRALKGNDLFIEGIDYQPLAQNGQRLKNGQFKEGENVYLLSVPCLEFFIARKVRPVFEVYRQVFHKAMNETGAKVGQGRGKDALTLNSVTDRNGNPVIDARCYYLYIFAHRRKNFSPWIKERIEGLGLEEGRDYAVEQVTEHKREYSFSVNTMNKVLRRDTCHTHYPQAKERMYSLLALMRDLYKRERTGEASAESLVDELRSRVYSFRSPRRKAVVAKPKEEPEIEIMVTRNPRIRHQQHESPKSDTAVPVKIAAKPLPVTATGETSLLGTLKRLSAFNQEISTRFSRMLRVSGDNANMEDAFRQYTQAYNDMQLSVGVLSYMEAVCAVEGEQNMKKNYGKEVCK